LATKKKLPELPSSIGVGAVPMILDLDEKIWTNGPFKIGALQGWQREGLKKPNTRRGLLNTKKDETLHKIQPFKNLIIYPSHDPVPPNLRALFRVLMEENPWAIRANTIIQQLVITHSTRTVMPRKSEKIKPEELEKWNNTPIQIPYGNTPEGKSNDIKPKMTPKEIEEWVDNYSDTLDVDSMFFDAFLFKREQGRSCIGMFPEQRNKDGKYVLPTALKLFESELLRRPHQNFDTGELFAIEVTGLTSNGSLLDANRAIYDTNSKNPNLFGTFYGKLSLLGIAAVGQVQLIIYGRDFDQAALHTWKESRVFKHTLPTRKWSEARQIMDNFNTEMERNQSTITSVTHNVELINSGGTDSGDLTGLIAIDNQCIDAIAGFYNIPPFMFAKGKAGNLGGNANREEIDAFLEVEIKPQQEQSEKVMEDQFYDRILAVLFDVEPEEVNLIPIKINHNYEKPNIATPPDETQWNIHMFLVDNGFTTMEQVMEKFGMRDLMQNSPTLGSDPSPTIKTWKKQNHPTWDNTPKEGWNNTRAELKRNFHVHPKDSVSEIIAKKKELLDSANESIKIKNEIERKKQARADNSRVKKSKSKKL